MAVSQSFRTFVLDQLGRVVPVVAKSMFGGVGLYSGGLFFALIAEDQLYFKVDASNQPDFEKRKMSPFMPFGDDRPMSYFEVPADVLEDLHQLGDWTQKAIDAARRAKGKKSKPKKPGQGKSNLKIHLPRPK